MHSTILRAMTALTIAAMGVTAAAPAAAHEEHRRQREAALKAKAEALAAAKAETAGEQRARIAPGPVDHDMMDMPAIDRSTMSPAKRLLDWIGRLHPIVVHFPIAFLPAAFFTALVGRKRPAFTAPVKFLVVAGGILAPISAVLGWIDGGFLLASDDWLVGAHRWLGTLIGAGAFGLAIWALRKPQQDRSPAMIAALGVMTVAIVIQGWLGGALTHGVAHLNW